LCAGGEPGALDFWVVEMFVVFHVFPLAFQRDDNRNLLACV